jgi:hypothetical protein
MKPGWRETEDRLPLLPEGRFRPSARGRPWDVAASPLRPHRQLPQGSLRQLHNNPLSSAPRTNLRSQVGGLFRHDVLFFLFHLFISESPAIANLSLTRSSPPFICRAGGGAGSGGGGGGGGGGAPGLTLLRRSLIFPGLHLPASSTFVRTFQQPTNGALCHTLITDAHVASASAAPSPLLTPPRINAFHQFRIFPRWTTQACDRISEARFK